MTFFIKRRLWRLLILLMLILGVTKIIIIFYQEKLNFETILWSEFPIHIDKKIDILCRSLEKLQAAKSVYTVEGTPQLANHSPFVVVNSYFKARSSFNNSVTYSTHSTFEYLSNLVDVVNRWDGPIEIAVFSPYSDFCLTLDTILYLRNCGNPFIREKVTWHIFWPKIASPPIKWQYPINEAMYNCPSKPIQYQPSWRKKHKHPYPINVGRNIARQSAKSHYVMNSDIELYPSQLLSSQFMSYVKTRKEEVSRPEIFVVPVFETNYEVPETKEELQILLKNGSAIYFHKLVCAHCQKFPGLSRWIADLGTPGKFKTFAVTKRHYPFHRWEPIFIGSKKDPLYDEHLTWEGFQDKMIQMYEMCLRNYSLIILDRAFLVHSKGIKHKFQHDEDKFNRRIYVHINSVNYNVIASKLEKMHGSNPFCKKYNRN